MEPVSKFVWWLCESALQHLQGRVDRLSFLPGGVPFFLVHLEEEGVGIRSGGDRVYGTGSSSPIDHDTKYLTGPKQHPGVLASLYLSSLFFLHT